MKGYFVTGTDTGVGKTFVTCLLARHAVSAGKRVFAFKPIETGCAWSAGKLVGEDGEALSKAAGDWQTGELRGLYRFQLPAAPVVAATSRLDFDRVREVLQQGSGGCDVVLVEGAGGWRVPLTADADTSMLARIAGLPILVVARATLGTINHSLLTIEAIQRDGFDVAGLVLSHRPQDDLEVTRSNLQQIRARTDVTVEIVADDVSVTCFAFT